MNTTRETYWHCHYDGGIHRRCCHSRAACHEVGQLTYECPPEDAVNQWNYAVGSWCLRRPLSPDEGAMRELSNCRWLAMGGDAGAKPGHEKCEPLLDPAGVKAVLEGGTE